MTKQDIASSVKERIQELEALRYDAVLKEDYERFATLAHKDLVYTHSNGERDSLASYIEKCRSGKYRYHTIQHPIEDIVVVDNVAVVIGGMTADISVSGAPKRLDNTAIAVWVKQGDAWLLLAYQPTPKPAPTAA